MFFVVVNVVEAYYTARVKPSLETLPGVTGSLLLLEDIAQLVGPSVWRANIAAMKTAPQLMELSMYLSCAIPFGQPINIRICGWGGQ